MHAIIIAGNVDQGITPVSQLLRLETIALSLEDFDVVVIVSNIEVPQNFQFQTKKIKYCRISGRNAGALTTVVFGLSEIPEDSPFVVIPSNATILNRKISLFSKVMTDSCANVGAMVFQGSNPIYSYARLDKSKNIIEIVEKQVFGSCSLAGVYFFKNPALLLDCAEWAMINNVQNEGNFFISPSLNYFIANSINISLFEIEASEYARI